MTEIGLLSRCELYLKLSRHLVPGNDLNYDAHTHTTVAILINLELRVLNGELGITNRTRDGNLQCVTRASWLNVTLDAVCSYPILYREASKAQTKQSLNCLLREGGRMLSLEQ